LADKLRVHILAKELNVPSKVIIEKCKAEGIDTVKNHMSTLSAGLHATISEWFTEGTHGTAVETAQRVDLKKVRLRRPRKTTTKAKAEETVAEDAETAATVSAAAEAPDAAPAVAEAVSGAATATAEAEVATDAAEAEVATAAAEAGVVMPAAEAPGVTVEREPTEAPIPEEVPAVTEPQPAERPSPVVEAAPPAAEPETGIPTEGVPAAPPEEAPTVPSIPAPPTVEAPPKREPTPIVPAGPQNVPAKVKLQGPRVVRYEAPDQEVLRPRRSPGGPRRVADSRIPGSPEAPAPTEVGKPGDRGPGRRRGRTSTRRTAGRPTDAGERVAEWGDRDLAERRERLAGATGRRIRRRVAQGSAPTAQPVSAGPKTVATVHEPVRMKEFCSETGSNFMQCFKVLRDEHQVVANVNMTLATELAELLALHFGIELTVIPSKTQLDELKEEFAGRERKHAQHRPPVVTLLGHVDHGKTSLLDAIRATRVVAGEDGGITQHLGAYHIRTPQGAVTFLDTPGHEAFTGMRARGAQLTDVVVLVVAADDGVMPQTIEAIDHAKAADVPIVVALNKIDLGDQNNLKIYGQLSEQGLTPSGDWGGDVDVIPTSATTGVGVQELVEHLADLSGLLDLSADAKLPALGTVLEAETKSGVGAVVRVLVQEGTLRLGDFVVCGPAYGKVRALLDDRGQRIKAAGPSLPVEVWGLDDVPTAGDRLYALASLQRAKDIATETKQTRIESARVQSRKVRTLEEMVQRRDSEEVPELNLVIKADVDGSLAALRQSLGDLRSDEVKLTIRHTGVGAINDGDVLLAAACEGIVVAFRVDTSVAVRRLAEQHGVDVRPYRVIYDTRDDIKKALEGLLAPEERVERRGSAEVRELFRLGKKIGVVAGSYVTEGTIDRKHFAKIIRDGVIVREGCRFASLRRFKDDAKEVRAGLECGIRLEGFDDVHVGDIIETYDITEVARTL
jgi:translation initiation factor IF-2